MAKKVSPMTDIKSLPKWQKYTIIAILFALALAFTMSGAMVAVVGYMTEKKNPPMGIIGDKTVEYNDFYSYYSFFRTVYSRQTDAKSLLFSKMPTKSSTGEILLKSGYSDSYYIDYIAKTIENENLGMKNEETSELFFNKLAWNHILLFELAKKNNIMVKDDAVREIARQVLLGSPEMPQLPPARPEPAESGDENTEGEDAGTDDETIDIEEVESRRANLSQLWQIELSERENEYESTLSNDMKMDEDDFENIIRECLTVKRYMDQLISGNIKISRKDILRNIDAFKNELKLQYIRLNSDHAEVLKRAKEKLADEIAGIALKKELWQSSNLQSADELFVGPLEKIYRQKLQSEDEKFTEPKYRLKVITSEFESLKPYVIIPDEIIKQFFEHYKSVFFVNDKTEDEITDEVNALKQKWIKEHANDETDTPSGDADDAQTQPNEQQPVEGWDEWKKNKSEELKYKKYEEVKDEAKKLVTELAAPKFAAAAIKKLKDEIDNRIQKNQETLDKQRENKDEVLRTMKQLEEIFFGGLNNKGLFLVLDEFNKTINDEIESIKRKCSINFDEDDKAILTQISMEIINEALIYAWKNIESQRTQMLFELRLTDNPYSNVDNLIADTNFELKSLNTEISRVKNEKELTALMRVELLEKNRDIIQRRLELLVNVRAELMKTFKHLKEAFREATLLSESLGKDFSVSKGFLDAYFDEFKQGIAQIMEDFSTRLKVNEIADEVNSEVQNLEIELKRFESQIGEKAKNLSRELPPKALLNLKITGFQYSEFGLTIHEIELSKVYSGVSIKGMWGAGVPPYEFKSAMTIDEISNNPWIMKNMPYLVNSSSWDYQTNSAQGKKFKDVLNELTVGSYSEAIGVTGIGVYMLFLEEKVEDNQPKFADVQDKMIQDYIDQSVSDIAREYASEIRLEIDTAIDEILNSKTDEILGLAETYTNDKDLLNKFKQEFAKADYEAIFNIKRQLANVIINNIAEKHDVSVKETNFVNLKSDIIDIASDGGSDKDFINKCMKITPYFEMSEIGKETRPDENRNTKTNSSYIFARVIGMQNSKIKGAKVNPSDIVEDEVELLYKNLWARKILSNKEIMATTEIKTLLDKLHEQNINAEIYTEKLKDANVDR
ncbi:MAG: hypothetical protein K8S87_03720 [Planctomycetes bacterium]|nr:hypothetical protein [Planctomycetota bacterium]